MTSAEAFRQVAQKTSQPFLECVIVLGILAVAFFLLFMGRPVETIAPTLALFGAALIRLKSCVSIIVASLTNLRYNSVSVTPLWTDVNGLTKPGDHLPDTPINTEKLKSGIVVLGSVNGPKAFLIVGVTKDLTKRFHAGNLIKPIASTVGGSGGGRPDMAQAGGTKPEKLDAALEKAYKVIENS